jgi:hypothetical protein
METTADQRTHEARLDQIARIYESKARDHMLDGHPDRAENDGANYAAVQAGADALARVAALEAIIREGIPRYLQNGGCSNCGGLPHSSTCLVGQLAAALGVTPDSPGGTR